jgi:hypothetical protein
LAWLSISVLTADSVEGARSEYCPDEATIIEEAIVASSMVMSFTPEDLLVTRI